MKSKLIKINDIATNYIIYENGDVVNIKRNTKLKVLKYGDNKRCKDYPQVKIYYKENGEVKSCYKLLHRLIAEYFINNPNPELYDQVNHIDGDKNNWDIENLEWCDRSYNMKHSYEYNLHKKICGEDSHLCKLSDINIHYICRLYMRGYTTSKIIKILLKDDIEVSQTYLDGIRSGKKRKDISSLYTFPERPEIIIERKYPHDLKNKISDMILSGESNYNIRKLLKLNHDVSTKNLLAKMRMKISNNNKRSTTIETKNITSKEE